MLEPIHSTQRLGAGITRLSAGCLLSQAACLLNHTEEALQFKGLGQVVISSRPQRPHRSLRVVMAGQHDHRHIRTDLAQTV